MLLTLLTLAACRPEPAKDRSDSPTPDSPGGDTDSAPPDTGTPDTGTPLTWTTLPATCAAPAALPADALVLSGQARHGQDKPGAGWFTELLDLELLGTHLAGVGQGGLMLYDIQDPAAPALAGRYPADQDFARFHRVEALADGVLAVTHRDHTLALVDASDPTDLRTLWQLNRAGLEGLARVGDRLYVTERGRGLVVFDVSDPSAPVERGAALGLSAPWELSPAVDGWLYVADNTLGVVPVDISNPDAPALGVPVALPGATQHLAVDGDWMYAAIGGAGVAVLNRSDPSAPVLVTTVAVGGSATQVSVVDGVLFVADHEGLAALDVSDPTAPRPIAYEVTEQFALAVRGQSRSFAWVGDWNLLSGFTLDPEAQVGELDPASDELRLPTEGGAVTLRLSNRGGGPLTLHGATTSDPQVTVEVSATVLAPGESGWARLSWAGGEALDATLCLSSDDPDGPVRTVPLSAGPSGDTLGMPAPDFALGDLDGTTHRLSEQLGHPVLLVYFATW